MTNEHILLPAIVLILWTLIYTMFMGYYRVSSAKKGELDPRAFKTYRDTSSFSDTMLKISNHYDNLMSMPILFYVVVLMIYVTNTADTIFIGLAWTYVLARFVHSFIHLGRNNPIKRFMPFAFSLGFAGDVAEICAGDSRLVAKNVNQDIKKA